MNIIEGKPDVARLLLTSMFDGMSAQLREELLNFLTSNSMIIQVEPAVSDIELIVSKELSSNNASWATIKSVYKSLKYLPIKVLLNKNSSIGFGVVLYDDELSDFYTKYSRHKEKIERVVLFSDIKNFSGKLYMRCATLNPHKTGWPVKITV